jgi:hypothetical protein
MDGGIAMLAFSIYHIIGQDGIAPAVNDHFLTIRTIRVLKTFTRHIPDVYIL